MKHCWTRCFHLFITTLLNTYLAYTFSEGICETSLPSLPVHETPGLSLVKLVTTDSTSVSATSCLRIIGTSNHLLREYKDHLVRKVQASRFVFVRLGLSLTFKRVYLLSFRTMSVFLCPEAWLWRRLNFLPELKSIPILFLVSPKFSELTRNKSSLASSAASPRMRGTPR